MVCLPEKFIIPLYIVLARNSTGKCDHYFGLDIPGLIVFRTKECFFKKDRS